MPKNKISEEYQEKGKLLVIIRLGDLWSIYSKRHQSSGFARKMRRNYEFRLRAKAANILMFLSRFEPAAHVFHKKTAQVVRAKIFQTQLSVLYVLFLWRPIPWLGFESSLFHSWTKAFLKGRVSLNFFILS